MKTVVPPAGFEPAVADETSTGSGVCDGVQPVANQTPIDFDKYHLR